MEIVDVVLRVEAPTSSDVKKADIKVKIQSREYPDQSEERTFTFNLVIGLVMTPTSPTTVTKDPGDTFTIFFEALNDDPVDSHESTFSVIQADSSWPGSSFSFTPSTRVNIGGDSKRDMGLEVTVPSSAKADEFDFEVRGIVDGNSEVYTSFDFKVTINLRRELVVTLDPDVSKIDINTKDQSLIYLMIENRGNQVEHVNLTVDLDSSNVEVRINDALTSTVLNLAVQPGATEQVKVGFLAKEEASPNQVVKVTVSTSMGGGSTPIEHDLELNVVLSTSELAMKYLQWAIVAIGLLIAMGVMLLLKRGRRPEEVPDDTKDKDATHGTVVRH